jgi:bla regulator protein blaR1
VTSLVLGLLALVLAGLVPPLLLRLPSLRRTPAATLVLWQAVALAAVLAALGAGLALVTDRAWGTDAGTSSLVVAGVALAVTLTVVARLLLSAHLVGSELRRLRRRHLDQLEVVAARPAERDQGVRVLEHPLPVAYCLPGMGESRIVVSSGTLDLLTPAELGAVLAHEQAHLRARHDLVLEAFAVLHRAFPRGVTGASARNEVGLLVEVLADRAATRGGRGADLGRALLVVAGAGVPRGALGVAGGDLAMRAVLLTDLGPHRTQSTVVLLVAVAVVVLPTWLVVLPWLTALADR